MHTFTTIPYFYLTYFISLFFGTTYYILFIFLKPAELWRQVVMCVMDFFYWFLLFRVTYSILSWVINEVSNKLSWFRLQAPGLLLSCILLLLLLHMCPKSGIPTDIHFEVITIIIALHLSLRCNGVLLLRTTGFLFLLPVFFSSMPAPFEAALISVLNISQKYWWKNTIIPRVFSQSQLSTYYPSTKDWNEQCNSCFFPENLGLGKKEAKM